MKKKLSIALVSVLLISCKSYSQDNSKIQYIFPPKINEFLDEKISESSSKNPGISYYMILYHVTWVEERDNHLISIGTFESKPIDVIDNLISKSIHFYRLGKMEIPIIFDYDFSFVGYGTDAKGRTVRKNITGSSSFYVEFDRAGKIVDSNY
ncbi:MAG: hypothetical protein AAF693_12800 [Bacteroidota bacterium]